MRRLRRPHAHAGSPGNLETPEFLAQQNRLAAPLSPAGEPPPGVNPQPQSAPPTKSPASTSAPGPAGPAGAGPAPRRNGSASSRRRRSRSSSRSRPRLRSAKGGDVDRRSYRQVVEVRIQSTDIDPDEVIDAAAPTLQRSRAFLCSKPPQCPRVLDEQLKNAAPTKRIASPILDQRAAGHHALAITPWAPGLAQVDIVLGTSAKGTGKIRALGRTARSPAKCLGDSRTDSQGLRCPETRPRWDRQRLFAWAPSGVKNRETIGRVQGDRKPARPTRSKERAW